PSGRPRLGGTRSVAVVGIGGLGGAGRHVQCSHDPARCLGQRKKAAMASDTLTHPTTDTPPVRHDSMRRTARWAGVLYLLTVISVPTFALYNAVKDPGFIIGPGPDAGVLVGGIVELIVGLAGIGTAVALFPVVKRQGEARAMGFVGTRILEATMIFVGVASLW